MLEEGVGLHRHGPTSFVNEYLSVVIKVHNRIVAIGRLLEFVEGQCCSVDLPGKARDF